MIHVGIVGATGYTGVEICRLLQNHPEVSHFTLYSMQYAGKPFSAVYPQFTGTLDNILETFDPQAVSSDIDVLFLAIPHATSHAYLSKLTSDDDLKIIDLSADFRLDSESEFEKHYGVKHQSPELLGDISYAIPELYRDDIEESDTQTNALKSAYIENIASRVKTYWRFQGANDNWFCTVRVLQDRDGTVYLADVSECNTGNSPKAQSFKNSIERAVYKASPLPSAPDDSVFDKSIMFKFSAN